MQLSTIPKHISREKIPNLRCKNQEVLDCPDAYLQRKLSLQRAAQMSHSFYTKSRIVFDTEEGTMEVLTTIWAATDKYIVLKGGVSIPVACIREVVLA